MLLIPYLGFLLYLKFTRNTTQVICLNICNATYYVKKYVYGYAFCTVAWAANSRSDKKSITGALKEKL